VLERNNTATLKRQQAPERRSDMSEEEQANPYNARKSWHEEDDKATKSADSLFFEEDEATSQSGTPQQEQRPRTNYKKRYDDLKKHYDTKISEFKQREQELEAMARSAQPQYQPPKSAEDLERFKSEYPDLYDTVETVAHMRSEEQMNALQQKLSVIEMREAEMSKRDAELALRDRHPDFEDIRGDDNFHEWAKVQPEEIQRWIYKNPDNVSLASRAIDLYKMENNIKIKKSSRPSQLSKSNAADMVSTKTTGVEPREAKIWTQREIAALSIDEYDRYEQEIDRAIAEGRVAR
jgi:hypothetical protein|tara:strand:- start:1515 stop:2393 length:879 start_codon:yes stop_codon:yes gene_type:complete